MSTGNNRAIFALVAIMTVVGLVIGGAAILVLYDTAFEERREDLRQLAQSQARLIEAVAHYDEVHSRDYPGGSFRATFAQIEDAHERYKGFEETGEFVMARREGDEIVFLLRHHHGGLDIPKPVALDSPHAEPMRRALDGKSGTVVGLDFEGVTVLAAYEPVAVLNLGIVAKIDVAEIREPFVTAGAMVFAIGFAIIAAGAALFFRIGNPMVRRIVESEDRLRRSVLDAPIPIIMHAEGGEIMMVSNKWTELTGYSPGEIPSIHDWTEKAYGADKEHMRELIGRLYKIEEPYEHEAHIVTAWGEKRTWDVRTAPLGILPDGRRFVISMAMDVTERQAAEAAMMEAMEEAEKANLAKSEFLASMSHELRTPLNAVLGFAQVLQYDPENPLSPAQNTHVESILEGGSYLLKLVNDILDLAKIESDQASILLTKVAAREVVSDCVSLMAPLGEKRNIKIVDRLGSGLSTHIRTDRTRLKQVMINLLSNAVKFNRDGGTVTVDGRETDDGFLRISVTDTGIGLAKEDAGRAFQMFHRVGANSLVAREGTGMGLTVSRVLVERMAGRIGVESELGVGSAFWVELPLATNENILIWSDNLRVGVDAIDKDHQIIINLLNKLTHRFVGDADLDKVIEDMEDYTRYHFQREEAIMEVCEYPILNEHRVRHRKLNAEVSDLANKWRNDRGPETLHVLCRFLRKWWMGHILKVDTEIAQYADGKEEKIQEALEKLELANRKRPR